MPRLASVIFIIFENLIKYGLIIKFLHTRVYWNLRKKKSLKNDFEQVFIVLFDFAKFCNFAIFVNSVTINDLRLSHLVENLTLIMFCPIIFFIRATAEKLQPFFI